jgi:hypothetical protein
MLTKTKIILVAALMLGTASADRRGGRGCAFDYSACVQPYVNGCPIKLFYRARFRRANISRKSGRSSWRINWRLIQIDST